MQTIYTYSNEQAIEDGFKLQIGPNLFATTNLFDHVQPDGNIEEFGEKVDVLLRDYNAGTYFHPGSTAYPEETDQNFATYIIDGMKVWAMRDHDGLHLMLPEDY